MRLIATLGAIKPGMSITHKHRYNLKGCVYEEYFSFQAIAKSYGIRDEDVYIIGTGGAGGTFETLGAHIGHYNRTLISDDGEAKDVFAKVFDLSDEATYLDLTQGFRHIPMMAMVSALYAQHREGVRIKNIYYAKTSEIDRVPSRESCRFDFVSLLRFVDTSNISTMLETFLASAVVPNIYIKNRNFVEVIKALKSLSNYVFSNDIIGAIRSAKELKACIGALEEISFYHLNGVFERVLQDIETVITLDGKSETVQLLEFSRYLYKKNLLMQSLTLLYESILSFTEDEVRRGGFDLQGKDQFETMVPCVSMEVPFWRRKCVKKGIFKNRLYTESDSVIFSESFRLLLGECDRFRNAMAHAFTGERLEHNPRSKIRQFGERFMEMVQCSRT